MDDLVVWMRAQLDEDARRCELWHDYECELFNHEADGGVQSAFAALEMLSTVPGAVCTCGLPGRMLREIEMKRAVLQDLVEVIEASEDYKGPDYYEGVDACERTLKRMASVYADRPGYREEWRP